MDENPQLNTYIVIAAIIGGLSLGAIVLVGIFAPGSMAVAAWIVAALALMGGALGYFASKGS